MSEDDIYGRYCKVVEQQLMLPSSELSFKSMPDFCYMLEHTSVNYGQQYLKLIIKKWGSIFIGNIEFFKNLISLNDNFGKPNVLEFSKHITCSPSNLRYIYFAFIVLDDMKKKNITETNVIEVGGGYGGLCFYIVKMASLFDIKIGKYALFDLEYPMKLQDRFLKEVGVENHVTTTVQDVSMLEENSYFVSTYSFSEIPKECQEEYTKYVLNPFVSNGFIAWNAIDVYDFIENSEINSSPEDPSSGPFSKNKFVFFSKE